jgi:GNAT superfamily N-acetyltransferase
MEYVRITAKHAEDLRLLQTAYKNETGEEAPSAGDLQALADAVETGRILFYGCEDAGRLIACCSVSPVFSTFNYDKGGVFEDFYILPEYRHRGIAKDLVRFAFEQSGVSSMTVGCADCDVGMYRALGFTVPLGNLLAFE